MIYVLQVQTGKEIFIRYELLRKNIPADVPRERILIRKGGLWSEKIKLLFPGYVFISADYSPDIFHEVKKISGVIRFLGEPTPLPEHEAEMIRWLSNGGEIIEPSIVKIGEDKNFTCCEGFLKGQENKIRYLNLRQKKAAIEVKFGGKLHRANISVETISE